MRRSQNEVTGTLSTSSPSRMNAPFPPSITGVLPRNTPPSFCEVYHPAAVEAAAAVRVVTVPKYPMFS